ncbi:MAG: hypothetical protein JKX94_04205 [Sneathiella sp.]|nr:hypothetical protein [Sneathiella sp.]
MDEYKEGVELYLGHLREVEKHLKIAERVRNEAIIPAVNELRYSGRYLSEIYLILVSELAEQNTKSPEKLILDKLRDANFACLKAKHDIMDAMNAQLDTELRSIEGEFGRRVTVEAIPNYHDMTAFVRDVDISLVSSREDRDNIDAHYDEMYKVHFPKIISHLESISDERCIRNLISCRRRIARNTFVGILVGTVTFFGALAAIGSYVAPEIPASAFPKSLNAPQSENQK